MNIYDKISKDWKADNFLLSLSSALTIIIVILQAILPMHIVKFSFPDSIVFGILGQLQIFFSILLVVLFLLSSF